jgi:hypothetical protein
VFETPVGVVCINNLLGRDYHQIITHLYFLNEADAEREAKLKT